jgi:hypothetical protein
LLKLLEHTLRGAGRVRHGEGYATPPEPTFFEVIAQPLYIEDFLTVIHDRELYGERIEPLVLAGPEGSVLSDWEKDATRIEVLDADPNYTVIYSTGGSGHPDREEAQSKANDKVCTVWLSLEVYNKAGMPARNVIVDFTVREAKVYIDQSGVGSQVHVEETELIPGGAKIRQRIAHVAAGAYEKLALMGIRPYGSGPGDEVAEASIQYSLRREDGITSDGRFEVRVRIKGNTQLTLAEAFGLDE